MAREVRLAEPIRQAIRHHARWCAPLEACGLIAVDERDVPVFAYPATNRDHSPSSFTVDATEHFRALQHSERNGWRIGGVFHSHPSSAAYPSPTDVAAAGDPTWVHLIVSGVDGTLRAYSIADRVVSELAIVG